MSASLTIEAVEGDKVRIFVTNKLPEHTTVHWHGMIVPNGMDGVGGLNQPHIKPGKTFVYDGEQSCELSIDRDIDHRGAIEPQTGRDAVANVGAALTADRRRGLARS